MCVRFFLFLVMHVYSHAYASEELQRQTWKRSIWSANPQVNWFWRLHNSLMELNESTRCHVMGKCFVKTAKLNQAQQMDPIISPK